jgi:cell division protein ZapA
VTKDGVNRVKVQIHGATYTLRGTESPEYLKAVAATVDSVMKNIAAQNPSLDQLKVAVLTALNLADELEKVKREYEELMDLLEERTSRHP